MSRKSYQIRSRKKIFPDLKYKSELVARLINCIMLKGKKNLACSIVYKAFDIIKEKTKKEPLEIVEKAFENVMPVVEVKARRIGGATYQIPVAVSSSRRLTLGMKWLIKYARLRHEKTMIERLAKEIIDATNNIGGAVKKKEEVHKMAEANKAFAHYRW